MKMILIEDLLKLLFDKKLKGVTRKQLFSQNRVIRHRAKNKLIDNIFLKDFKEPQLSLHKRFYIFTLLRLKQLGSKIQFGEKLLKEAIGNESYLIAFEICQILLLYSVETRHKKKYSDLALELLDKIKLEHSIISNYCEVLNGTELIEVNPPSKRGAFYYYFARVVYWEQRNSEKMVLACQKGIEYFKGQKHELHFLIKSFVPIIHGSGTNENILRYLEIEKGINFQNGCAYHAIYWTYKADYQKAVDICQETLKQAKAKAIIEQLKIIEAWASVMLDKKFRFQKFLNDITIFIKQKDAENAGLILLKVLYWIKEEKFDQIFDSEIALRRYARRYLKDRMLVMFQFIFLLIKASFKPSVDKINELKLKLDQFPRLAINVEIIPFEIIIDRFFK